MASKPKPKAAHRAPVRETADGPHADGGRWLRAGERPEPRTWVDEMQEAEDAKFRQHLALVQERLGYTLGGIKLNASATAQLAGEDRGWNRAGVGGFDAYPDRAGMNAYLTERFNLAGPAKNIIKAYTTFIYGTGWWPAFKDQKKQAEFDKWAAQVCWGKMARKIVRECCLYGAAPTVLYPLTWPANISELEKVPPPLREKKERRPDRATTFRVLPDSRLKAILTDPDDYTQPIAYCFTNGDGSKDFLVAPCDVIMPTTEALGTAQRGPSVLTPVLEWIVRLEKLANSRFYLNLTRSRIPVVRNVPGGKQAAGGDVNANIRALPPAGSVITEYGTATWTFPSMNVDAPGAADDWRLLVLMIASGVSLPEYLVLQDASNSNYASTLVASGPAHSMFLSEQDTYLAAFTALLDACGWSGYTLQPPPVVPQDKDKQASAHTKLVAAGIESRRTAAEDMGLDFDQEQDRMAQDADSDLFADEDEDAPPSGEGKEKKPEPTA